MRARQALGRGSLASAACVACCAPPIIAALGVTTGLAATAGIFLGLAAAIAVVLVGGGWIVARARRRSGSAESEPLGRFRAGRRADRSTVTRHRLSSETTSLDRAASPGNLSW